jgi:hypothetical protein
MAVVVVVVGKVKAQMVRVLQGAHCRCGIAVEVVRIQTIDGLKRFVMRKVCLP